MYAVLVGGVHVYRLSIIFSLQISGKWVRNLPIVCTLMVLIAMVAALWMTPPMRVTITKWTWTCVSAHSALVNNCV